MCFVQQEKIQPLQQGHLAIGRVYPRFDMIRFGQGQDATRDFLAHGNKILHDLPERLVTIVEEKGIRFSRISFKGRIVAVQDLPDPADESMLVRLQVYDVLKHRPFARVDLPPDLFFRQAIDDIHQRFMLVLKTG